MWGQAGQGAPGQQDVLRVLAPFSEGLTEDEIVAQSGLCGEVVQAALEELERHDVLKEEEGRWRFTVELMRRWVADGTGNER